MTVAHDKLRNPPIEEVVCGFIFEATPLDILDIGVYAEERRRDYPARELLPPITDNTQIRIELNPITVRTRLKNEAGDRILQLQPDRLYVNWKRGPIEYPRFSSPSGLKAHALREFEQYSNFIRERSEEAPELSRLELTKVDLLKEGRDYSSAADLRDVLKVVQVFDSIASTDHLVLNLNLREDVDEGSLQVKVIVGSNSTRIETHLRFDVEGELSAAFDRANARVNRVFRGLVEVSRLLGERP